MKETTKALLIRAEEDLKSAMILRDAGLHNNACMLSQQCIEKALKALIDYKDIEFPLSHNITSLVNTLKYKGKTTVPPRIVDTSHTLTTAYFTIRYTEDNMQKHEANTFCKLARFTFDWVSAIAK